MEILMNKKHLNRINRRCAKLIPSQHSDHQYLTVVSTFREISRQKNSILQPTTMQDRFSFNLEKFLSFCNKVKPKKNIYDELSRPKAISCQKIDHSFQNTKSKQNNPKINSKPHKLQQLNKTISFTFNQIIKTKPNQHLGLLREQDEIDLKNDEFKRRHQSLKNYQRLSIEQTTGMQRNTITSNTLYKPSICEIYKRKKQQEERNRRTFQMNIINPLITNQQRQIDDLMQLRSYNLYLKNVGQRLDSSETTQRIQNVFDKKTTQKYNRLLDTIRNSEKYCIESYDDYDKMLTLRSPISKRLRLQKNNKILGNYAEEWR